MSVEPKNTSIRKTNSMRVNDGLKKDFTFGCHTKSEICFTSIQNNDRNTRRSETSVKKKYTAEESDTYNCDDQFFNNLSYNAQTIDADHGDIGELKTEINNVDINVKPKKLDNSEVLLNNKSQLNLEKSSASLDSDIKAFKMSVQELLEFFFASVKDFEIYKTRYNEIVQKHKENSLVEIEQFVKELLYHIISGEELKVITDKSRKGNLMCSGSGEIRQSDESTSTENYLLDNISVQHDINNSSMLYEEVSNIWRKSFMFATSDLNDINLLCQSKVRGTNVASEANVVTSKGLTGRKNKRAVSLDNIKRIVSVMSHDTIEIDSADIPIPIKTSNAKKHIRIDNERKNQGYSQYTKNFLAKICSYICRKFRNDNVA